MKKVILITTLVFSVLVNILLVAYFTSGAQSSDWLVMMRSEDGNVSSISPQEFQAFYRAMVDMSIMNSPLPVEEDLVRDLMSDERRRKLALKTYINYKLVINEARQSNIIDEDELGNKMKLIAYFIQQQILINEYSKKVLLPDIRIPQADIDEILATPRGEEIIEEVGYDRAEKAVRDRLTVQQLEVELAAKIDELNGMHIFRYNDDKMEELGIAE